MKKWTKEDEEVAFMMFQKGHQYVDISTALGKTLKSIIAFLNRRGHSIRMRNRKIVKCKECGTDFETNGSGRQYTCSRECLTIYSSKNRTGRRRKERRNCNYCHKTTVGRPDQRYCSCKCNSAHKRELIFLKIEQGDVSYPSKTVRKYLIYKHGDKCMKCAWGEVNPKSGLVPIQMDHIDGNSDNNSLSNVRLLCPNCHSLTPTYGSLNANGILSRRKQVKLNHYYKNKIQE